MKNTKVEGAENNPLADLAYFESPFGLVLCMMS